MAEPVTIPLLRRAVQARRRLADTEEALGEFAAGMQKGRPAVVVAMTGSNGKTSVKTLVQGILSRAGRTYFNPGNRNNEIGLPLAVLDAPEDAEFAVYEMGAGKPGDIAYLTDIVRPDVSIVNNIAPIATQPSKSDGVVATPSIAKPYAAPSRPPASATT